MSIAGAPHQSEQRFWSIVMHALSSQPAQKGAGRSKRARVCRCAALAGASTCQTHACRLSCSTSSTLAGRRVTAKPCPVPPGPAAGSGCVLPTGRRACSAELSIRSSPGVRARGGTRPASRSPFLELTRCFQPPRMLQRSLWPKHPNQLSHLEPQQLPIPHPTHRAALRCTRQMPTSGHPRVCRIHGMPEDGAGRQALGACDPTKGS